MGDIEKKRKNVWVGDLVWGGWVGLLCVIGRELAKAWGVCLLGIFFLEKGGFGCFVWLGWWGGDWVEVGGFLLLDVVMGICKMDFFWG